MNTRRLTTLFALLFLALSLTACGGAEGDSTAVAPADETSADGAPAAEATIIIRPVGNQMEYAKTDLTVEAGEQVTLVFENTATSSAMRHNVVVLNTTEEAAIQRVGQAALQTGASKEYVPEDPAILAHTALAAPGETVKVTFTAPTDPGTYAYICTFPGHYMTMRGIMTVTG